MKNNSNAAILLGLAEAINSNAEPKAYYQQNQWPKKPLTKKQKRSRAAAKRAKKARQRCR